MSIDDPRRLRPGEIDPNPESKAARPDPVDMDEDEKEMLSEARARLANTRGKKAKRKAREKQLEESRRLAALQKRRELKAAGIELSSRARKSRGIDYNAEIPFQKVAPTGFFDTAGEDAAAEAVIQSDAGFKPVLKSKLDSVNRDEAEEKARKQDAVKLKRKREVALPEAVAQLNKLNDPVAMAKRGKLMLPPPQVTDLELEDVVKAGTNAMHDSGGGSHDVTRMLMQRYDQTPSVRPEATRTPRIGGDGDTVLKEAAAQAAMVARETPLKGGESMSLETLGDFSSLTPRPQTASTPNAVGAGGATPSHSGRTPSHASMHSTASRASEAMRGTPSRDALGINETSPALGSTSLPAGLHVRLQRERQAAISAQLSLLPAPVNEYTIVMPDVSATAGEATEEEQEQSLEEDALDAAEREDAAAMAAEAMKLSLRSSTIQRELPRPFVVNRDAALAIDEMQPVHGPPSVASQLLAAEMLRMLEADASIDPPKVCRPPRDPPGVLAALAASYRSL